MRAGDILSPKVNIMQGCGILKQKRKCYVLEISCSEKLESINCGVFSQRNFVKLQNCSMQLWQKASPLLYLRGEFF